MKTLINHITILLLLLFLGITGGIVSAQRTIAYEDLHNELKVPSKEVMNKYFNDPSFDYGRKRFPPNLFERLIEYLRNLFISNVDPDSIPTLDFWYYFWLSIEWLCYLIASVGIVLLIRKIFILNGISLFQKNIQGNAISTIDEEELSNAINYTEKIQEKMASEDYKGAIRYSFLEVLNHLINKEQIIWHRKKTNSDYTNEINNTKIQKYFIQSAYYFDHIWYGSFDISKEKCLAIVSHNKQLISL